MSVKVSENIFDCLPAGGETGDLLRSHRWEQTSIGTPDHWPQSLRTVLGIVLGADTPMFLFWGSDLICFYNDAFRASLGNDGKHPTALGNTAANVWPEIWSDIKPMIDQVLQQGKSVTNEDQLLPIYRNGRLEDVYWSYSYNPVMNDSGVPEGVFVTVQETTKKVKALAQLQDSERRMRQLISELSMPTAVYTRVDGVLYLSMINDVSLAMWGKDQSVIGMPLFDALPGIKEQKFPALLHKVFDTGEAHSEEDALVTRMKDGIPVTGYTSFNYKPLKDEQGIVTGVLATAIDVTENVVNRQRLEESNDQLQFAIEATELGTFDYSPATNTFHANERLKEWFGLPVKENIVLTDAINVMAEKDRQRVTDAINNVLKPEYGGHYDIEYAIVHPLTKLSRIVRAKGRAWFNEHNEAYRFNGTLQDVTEQVNARKKLEESERNVRLIISQAPVSIAIFRGAEYVTEIANDKALELWGRTGEEVLNKPILEAMPELERQGIKELLDDVYRNGRPFATHERPVSLIRNGIPQQTYINFAYEPLHDMNGNIDGILTVGIEVTEQVLARHKIEENEWRVRLLIEHAPFPIAVYTGKEMRIELANQAVLDAWGKGNDVIGKTYAEVLPELEGKGPYEQLDHVYTTGNPFHVQNQRIDLEMNGQSTPFYFNYSYTPLFDAMGHVYGVMNTAVDVTALNVAKENAEHAIEQLSKTSQRLQLALEAGNLGSYELDLASGAITCTQQCKINFGRQNSGDFTYAELEEMVLPEDRAARSALVQAALDNKTVFEAQYRIKWADGSVHWIHAAGMPVYNEEGVAVQIIGVTTDITRQKVFEQELSRQVQERTAELGRKNIELEKMNEELKSFAYVSSHDLQEPLRKIQTFSDRILEKESANLSEAGKDYFRRMQNAARRMQTLIEDLLAYSRTSSAERVFQLTDLEQVMNEFREEFKDALQAKNAVIATKGLGNVNIIPFQFRQLLQNLVSNALKFSAPDRDPVITIAAETIQGSHAISPGLQEDKKYEHISISDNGIGFEPEYSERIFEVFQRLHSVSEYQGTGIGLAIVKKIVENHGGVIMATGRPDEGAVFDIYLPE